MPEHHTRNTLEVTAFCRKCERKTQHRVDGGRQGPCIDPEHENPLRTIPGERQFRVIYLDLRTRQRKEKDFERFDEALALFSRFGSELATLWKTSTTPHQHLR